MGKCAKLQRLKRLPGMWKTQVRSQGREDPLEKEMATHSSTLAWRISWVEEPGRLQSMGSQESDTTERIHFHFHFHFPLNQAFFPPLLSIQAILILYQSFFMHIFVSQ